MQLHLQLLKCNWNISDMLQKNDYWIKYVLNYSQANTTN